MKRSCLDEWLEALRSNKYTKCVGALHREDGFCPLGVLCDISGLDSWKEGFDKSSKDLVYLKQKKYLPVEVRQWAGINDQEYGMMSAYVMVFNDTEGFSFLEMADLLEAKYKKTKK